MTSTLDASNKPSIEQDESIGSVHLVEKGADSPHVDVDSNLSPKGDVEWKGQDVQFSHIDEKKVLRKMDIRLIPVLAVLYLMAFLDRGNVGNAKIEGLTEELKMTGPQYNICCMFQHFRCLPLSKTNFTK